MAIVFWEKQDHKTDKIKVKDQKVIARIISILKDGELAVGKQRFSEVLLYLDGLEYSVHAPDSEGFIIIEDFHGGIKVPMKKLTELECFSILSDPVYLSQLKTR